MTDIKLDGARVVVEGELDANSRMRVRQNGDTAGIWFHQSKPAADRAFVGMAADDAVGLYGSSGAGWGLVMNTSTGDVEVKKGALTVHGVKIVRLKDASGLESTMPASTSIVLEEDAIRVTAGQNTIDLVAEVRKLRDEVDALQGKGKGDAVGVGHLFSLSNIKLEPGV